MRRTFRIPAMFPELRRFVYLVRRVRAAGDGVTTGITLKSMNLKTRQLQSCVQVTFRTNTMIQDVNSAFSSDQSVLNLSRPLYTVAAAPQTLSPALRRHPPSSGVRIVLLYIKVGTRNVSRSGERLDSAYMWRGRRFDRSVGCVSAQRKTRATN